MVCDSDVWENESKLSVALIMRGIIPLKLLTVNLICGIILET